MRTRTFLLGLGEDDEQTEEVRQTAKAVDIFQTMPASRYRRDDLEIWGKPEGGFVTTRQDIQRRARAAVAMSSESRFSSDSAILYTDFDNTLHAAHAYMTTSGIVAGSPSVTLFEFAPILEDLLAPYGQVRIVLSTSWVEVLGYEEARSRLPLESLRNRVVGATYDPQSSQASVWSSTARGIQVLRHVRRHGVKRWLAIDDDRSGFEGYESRLIHCQQGVGLGDKDVQQLFARRLELMFGQPDSLSSADALTPERPT